MILYFVIYITIELFLYNFIFYIPYMYMKYNLNLIEKILMVALIIALICSIIIFIQVYVLKNTHYERSFSTWQMPMIFAILADLILIR